MQSSSIMARLKAETNESHVQMESHPFVEALVDHSLPLECYVRQLRALAIVHAGLERELAAAKEPRVAAIWSEDLRKLDLLLADIAHFESAAVLDSQPVVDAALALAERIRLLGIEQPIALVGYLYVLEGSTLGNALHGRDVVATFDLEKEAGCRYYASYPDDVRGHWADFSARVDRVLADGADQDAIVDAAIDAFAGLAAVYDALYPIDAAEKVLHITRINPEAGNHPMPQDPGEIAAALRASRRGWDDFVYFEARYGARGERFSDSDACWLAALADLEPEAVEQQVDWLARVLATRGMPQIMLERTLEYLYAELAGARPDRAAAFDPLKAAAARLRAARTAVIAEDRCRALANAFEQRVRESVTVSGQDGALHLAGWRDTGLLLASAVADEQNGIDGTVAAIHGWLTDPERFSAAWIAAVDETLQAARAPTS